MSDFLERRIGRFTLRIDRLLCVRFGDCIDVAPDMFVPDDEDIVRFRDPTVADEDLARRACEACPVDALSAFDETGAQIAP